MKYLIILSVATISILGFVASASVNYCPIQGPNGELPISKHTKAVRLVVGVQGSDQQPTLRRHVEELRERLPNREFNILVEAPFVVIGDESLETLTRRAKNTVRWAVRNLKRKYFEHDPDIIINIWLFKDKSSYETHVRFLFGSKPSTPFGFYSSQHQALVMNISTGGGTLVHEIVHPFMERNFPECPSWFNEGLASLYEQCGTEKEQIWGYTNWRLRGLQTAIRSGRVLSFQELCNTSTDEFYRGDTGVYYGQARYLCYYLQEIGELENFYRRFRDNIQTDPTGFGTLKTILGNPNMQEFQKEWEQFVLKLRFR